MTKALCDATAQAAAEMKSAAVGPAAAVMEEGCKTALEAFQTSFAALSN